MNKFDTFDSKIFNNYVLKEKLDET